MVWIWQYPVVSLRNVQYPFKSRGVQIHVIRLHNDASERDPRNSLLGKNKYTRVTTKLHKLLQKWWYLSGMDLSWLDFEPKKSPMLPMANFLSSLIWKFRFQNDKNVLTIKKTRLRDRNPEPDILQLDPLYWHGFISIQAWISNYIRYNVWDEITNPFPNFNGATVEVWEWISNLIPQFTEHMIIYPCWD